MKKRIASLLLVCSVVLSIVYSCSSIALSSHATESTDPVLSWPTTVTEELRPKRKLSYPGLMPLGDPIDDPTPYA